MATQAFSIRIVAYFPTAALISACIRSPEREGCRLSRRQELVDVFMYFKHYTIEAIMPTVTGRELSRTGVMSRIHRTAEYLAPRMRYVHGAWTRRHHPSNHLPHAFGAHVVAVLDSFPIMVQRPKDPLLQQVLYQGKYHGHCVKVQLACNHSGVPIWLHGPSFGHVHDLEAWRVDHAILAPGEQWLADKAYAARGKPPDSRSVSRSVSR